MSFWEKRLPIRGGEGLRAHCLPNLLVTVLHHFPTYSVCAQHGYLTGEQPVCPECGLGTEVYSRIVGYLRPVSQWNEGKQAEFRARRTFAINEGSGAIADMA